MERHASAMSEKEFHSILKKKLSHERRHERAMGAPCHARALWRKNVFLVMLKKLFHTKRHASAMGAPWGVKSFLSNLDQKFQMEGSMGAPCERLVSNAGGKSYMAARHVHFLGKLWTLNLTWWDAIGAAFRHVNCFRLVNPHYFTELICRH